MSGCVLCPRHCMVMRDNGEKGFCRETDHLRVARAALHMWEEPCISGEEGSLYQGLQRYFWNCSKRGQIISIW